MEKARISGIQLFLLISGFLFGSTIIINPVLSAKKDAWLATLLGGIGGTVLIGIYVAIALLNPSKTLAEILRDRFGKLIGNIFTILYVWYFIHLASLVFRNLGEFICAVTLPHTPMNVIIGLFAVLLAYAINGGIEVLGRLSEIFVPVIPVISIIISLALITTHDFTAFLPFLENGIHPVLNAAFGYVTFPFGEAVALLMLFPHLNKKEKMKNITIFSSMFMTIYSFLFVYRYISVLGSELMSQTTYASHLTSLLIPGLNVQPLIDINLLIGGGIKISVCIYAAARALSQIAGIRDYRKLTGAIIAFCIVLSMWLYNSAIEMFDWAEKVWPYYSIPFQIVIPLMLLILSLNKSKNSIMLKS